MANQHFENEILKCETSLMQRACGRDDELLALAGLDERRQTEALGATLVIAALVRVFTTTAALIVFAVDWRVAIAFGSTLGLLFYFIDRVFTHSMDVTQAERALHRIGASDFKRLSSNAQIIAARILRVVFAVITSVVLAGAIALYLHDADMREVIVEWQRAVDEEAVSRAKQELLYRRAPLEEAVEERQTLLEAARSNASRPMDIVQEGESARQELLTSEVARLDRLIDAAQTRAIDAEAGALEADFAAECELNVDRFGCEGISSGNAGRGDIYDAAKDRAATARDMARQALEEARQFEMRRQQLIADLASIGRTDVSAVDPGDNEEVRLALDALNEASAALHSFDQERETRIEALMANDPQWFQYNPDSLILRVKALLSSLGSPIEFAIVIGTVLFGLVIDLAPYIAAAAQAPGIYALRQAARIEEVAREVRNTYAQAKHDDQALLYRRDEIQRDEERRQFSPFTRWRLRHLENGIRQEDLRGELLRRRRANDAFDTEIRFDQSTSRSIN